MSVFDDASQSLGVPKDQIVLMFTFFASVPLGLLQYYFVRGAFFRHLYSIVIGLSFLFLQYTPKELVNFVVTSLVVYLMLLILPRKKAAFPILVFSLCYLSFMHIYRLVTDYMGWKMDPTGVQMLMTCKLTLLAYAYQDGEMVKTDPDRVPLESRKLIVEKLPNLFEYYSYILFYPSICIGPSFEFNDYLAYINEKNEFSKIPNTLLPSLRVLGFALVATLLTLFGDKYFPHTHCTSEEFYNKDLLYKIGFFNMAMVVAKMRYTTAWKFTEAGMIASGLGYTVDSKGQSSWNRAISINWGKTEYAWTAKEMVENWNISVSLWLRRCIFNRILVSGKDPNKPSSLRKSMAQHSSYLLSAFWHGFYPAYYIMFFLFSIHSEISKMVYVSDWSKLPAKTFFKWVAWALMWQIGNFLGIVFLSLDFKLALRFITSIYCFPVIQLALAWSFFKVTGFHIRRTKKE